MFFIQYFVVGGRRKRILLLTQHQIISRHLICSNRIVQFAIMMWPWPFAITSFFQTQWILAIHINTVFQKKKNRKIKVAEVFNNIISSLSNKTVHGHLVRLETFFCCNCYDQHSGHSPRTVLSWWISGVLEVWQTHCYQIHLQHGSS